MHVDSIFMNLWSIIIIIMYVDTSGYKFPWNNLLESMATGQHTYYYEAIM